MPGRLKEDTHFADRYRILAPLGEGAMGFVFLVYDEALGRECALKILKPQRAHSEDLERFNRELRATARLDHPHCIRSFEHGIYHGRAFLTMEYVPGGSLSFERWDDPDEVIELGLQLLSGLDHIHSCGLIHRDIKPQNLFVDRGPEGLHARLGDLGVVKVADFRDEGLGVGDLVGSLRFLAPETLEHGTADPRSDLYALGLVLLGLLAGKHPLGVGKISPRQWLTLHRRGQWLDIDRDDVSPDVIDVLRRMCARQPDDRFVSVAVAYDALESFGPKSTAHQRPPLQRRPYLAAPAFVGREPELARARRFGKQSKVGMVGPSVLYVEGGAGLGKSRLVRELLADALDDDDRIFVGTCPAEGGSPYQPLRELLESLHGTSLDEVADSLRASATLTKKHNIRHGCASPEDPTTKIQTSGSSFSSDSSQTGAVFDSAAISPDDQALARLRLHDSLTAQLRQFCRGRPVLIVLDDAQWADPPTLQLLGNFARAVALSRHEHQAWSLGIIMTHRPVRPGSRLDELSEAMREAGIQERITLKPLSDGDATALVASMLVLDPTRIPDEFAMPLLAKAEGSPLFLSQMMRLLLGKGIIATDPQGRWELDHRRLGAAALPTSVTRAIGERAARLATVSKQVLAAASVVGRSFDSDMISAIVDEDELMILDGFDELVRAAFIEDVPGRYRFVHDRIREAVYDALLPENRIALHQAVSIALEERGGGQPEVWPSLAHHCEQGERPTQAYHYAILAADHAMVEYAHGAAEQMYALALRLAEACDRIDVDSKVWERRGDAAAAVARYADAAEYYRQRLETSRSTVDRRVLLNKLGMLEHKRGRYDLAVRAIERSLEMAGFEPPGSTLSVQAQILRQTLSLLGPISPWEGSLEEGDTRAGTLSLLAECWYYAGDHTRTIHYAIASANVGRSVGASPGSVRAISGLGYSLAIAGLYRIGQYYLNYAHALSRQIKLPDNEACQLNIVTAAALATEGRCTEALAVLDETTRKFSDSANADARMVSLVTHMFIRLAVGEDLPRVERMSVQMQHIADELGDIRRQAWALEAMGRLAIYRSRSDEGLDLLRRGFAKHMETSLMSSMFSAANSDALALFLALEGQYEEALKYGHFCAEAVIEGSMRHFYPVDGGFVVAAALAKHHGVTLSEATERLVRRSIRKRRGIVRASRLTELQFSMGEAAWRRAGGRRGNIDPVIERAKRVGYWGQAWVGHRISAAFGGAERPRHMTALQEIQRRFELV